MDFWIAMRPLGLRNNVQSMERPWKTCEPQLAIRHSRRDANMQHPQSCQMRKGAALRQSLSWLTN